MMDVPQGNALSDPYGGATQAPYPWRGRITCFPGPAQVGSADRTAMAQSQVGAFVGATQPADLPVSGETVVPGPGADWGYRRLVLHMARLAQIAGGVDAMSADERGSVIEGMVASLDQRLRAEPDDLEGWKRLIRARIVLDQDDGLRDALERARSVYEDRPEQLESLRAFAEGLGVNLEEYWQ